MGDAGGFEGHVSRPQHQGGEAGAAPLRHLACEDVSDAWAVIVAMKADAATGGDGDLADAQLPAC
jgi:hypothetical protein